MPKEIENCRRIIPENDGSVYDVSIKELAEYGDEWRLTSSLSLTPGYHPENLYTKMPHAPYPRDTYATLAKLGCRSIISATKYALDNVKENFHTLHDGRNSAIARLVSLLNLRKNHKDITSENNAYILYAKILGSPLSDEASVYFSPQEILQFLTRFIEAKQTITLEEKLIIKPDYGFVDKKPNEHTVTTGDLFCIVINPGAKLTSNV